MTKSRIEYKDANGVNKCPENCFLFENYLCQFQKQKCQKCKDFKATLDALKNREQEMQKIYNYFENLKAETEKEIINIQTVINNYKNESQ